MAAGDAILGRECKLYYNSGNHASPTWVVMDRVIDLTIPNVKGEGNVSSRETQFNLYKGGQIDASIEFGYRHIYGTDTVRDVLKAAYFNGTYKEFAAVDGLINTNTTQGLRAFCENFGWSQPQELETGLQYDIVLKPTRVAEGGSLVAPDWYVVGS